MLEGFRGCTERRPISRLSGWESTDNVLVIYERLELNILWQATLHKELMVARVDSMLC